MRLLKTFSWATVATLLLGISVALKFMQPAMLEAMQYKLFDRYQVWHMRADEDLPVKIVDIDDPSLVKLGQWPWPRTQLAELARKLGEMGAAAIVFDIVFAEPDRTSPKHMQEVWRLQDSHALESLPDHDDIFAQEIEKWPVVTGAILRQETGGTTKVKTGFAYVGASPIDKIAPFAGIIGNIPQLEEHTKGNGVLNSDPDQDGILRRIPLVFRVNDTIYPALVVEALRVAQGASSVIIKSVGASDEHSAWDTAGITAMKIGDIEVPTDAEGRFWVYFNEYKQSRYISAWRVLEDQVNPEDISGQIVFVGTSAPGLKDLRATPLNPSVGGVEVHAQALEQMLQGISLKRPDWAIGAEVLMVLLSGIIALWSSARFGALLSATAITSLIVGVSLISWHAFTTHHLLLEPITSIITMLLVYFVATVWRFAETERDKGRIKDTFSLYMSEALVDELAAHPDKLKLGGEKKNISVMFSDIRNFSAISERLEPEALTRLINRYLTPMTDVILRSGGTIDKYMGDAIMAIWNAPLDIAQHPEKAVQAALTMRDELTKLNADLAEDPAIASRITLPIKTGMGINTGDCSVGNMGSSQRFEYSVMGHEVDLASRLEGLCKYYGVDIIISERTKISAGDVATIELDQMRVKGKSEIVKIFALLAGKELTQNTMFQELLSTHLNMLAAYRKAEADTAEILLHECRILASHIPLMQVVPLYKLYESRIEDIRLLPANHEWDGVFNADFK